MNATTAPRDHDDLDRLLGTFFRGEVPTPWPPLNAAVVTPVRRRAAGPLSAGRLALAASVAALLAGGWFISGRLPGPPIDGGSLDSGKATVPADLRPGTTLPTPPRRR